MTINVPEVKRRLFVLLHDSNLVSEYIRQYGPTIDIKNIKVIKEKKKKTSAGAGSEDKGKDPIFSIKVKCPICNRDDIDCHEMRAKSQIMNQNKFLVPSYEGTMGYRTVNYSMESVTVCPRCLFASPDKKDFMRPAAAGQVEVKSQLTSNMIMTLQEKIGERHALLKYVSNYEEYFKRPRIDDAAVASYRLAMMRANVEAWYEQPYSLYKLGSYSLKIAKIIKDGGGDNLDILREASSYFEEAFRTSNCPSEDIEMQVIYLLVALNLKLKDEKKASSYIGFFANLRTTRLTEMREDPKLNTVYIDKWQSKAKYLWEDRGMEDLFKDE